MKDLHVATVQFEARDGDKDFNLERIRALTAEAVAAGAEFVSFHECSVTGYTFLMTLQREQLLALAEEVPDGASVERLRALSSELGVPLGAGLLERDGDALFNTYVVVSPTGFVARHRKIHAFVSPFLTAGSEFTVFELLGWRWGILICYDNNLAENVRITALQGADIILMPHVTGGTPSPMPGRGVIDRSVWENRHNDPVSCRQEFRGPKGRGWLMRWLPCRVYENGVFALFSNQVGIDHDTIKPGGAMALDPYGEVLSEAHALGDDVVLATLDPTRLEQAPGRRYRRARRPELYKPLVAPPPAGEPPSTTPGWTLERPPGS